MAENTDVIGEDGDPAPAPPTVITEESFPFCTVCLETFHSTMRVPKLFPCGHSFCEECCLQLLNPLVLEAGCVSCPTCRVQSPLHTQRPQDTFRTNFELRRMLEALEALKSSGNLYHCSQCRTISREQELTLCNSCHLVATETDGEARDFMNRLVSRLICFECAREHHPADRSHQWDSQENVNGRWKYRAQFAKFMACANEEGKRYDKLEVTFVQLSNQVKSFKWRLFETVRQAGLNAGSSNIRSVMQNFIMAAEDSKKYVEMIKDNAEKMFRPEAPQFAMLGERLFREGPSGVVPDENDNYREVLAELFAIHCGGNPTRRQAIAPLGQANNAVGGHRAPSQNVRFGRLLPPISAWDLEKVNQFCLRSTVEEKERFQYLLRFHERRQTFEQFAAARLQAVQFAASAFQTMERRPPMVGRIQLFFSLPFHIFNGTIPEMHETTGNIILQFIGDQMDIKPYFFEWPYETGVFRDEQYQRVRTVLEGVLTLITPGVFLHAMLLQHKVAIDRRLNPAIRGDDDDIEVLRVVVRNEVVVPDQNANPVPEPNAVNRLNLDGINMRRQDANGNANVDAPQQDQRPVLPADNVDNNLLAPFDIHDHREVERRLMNLRLVAEGFLHRRQLAREAENDPFRALPERGRAVIENWRARVNRLLDVDMNEAEEDLHRILHGEDAAQPIDNGGDRQEEVNDIVAIDEGGQQAEGREEVNLLSGEESDDDDFEIDVFEVMFGGDPLVNLEENADNNAELDAVAVEEPERLVDNMEDGAPPPPLPAFPPVEEREDEDEEVDVGNDAENAVAAVAEHVDRVAANQEDRDEQDLARLQQQDRARANGSPSPAPVRLLTTSENEDEGGRPRRRGRRRRRHVRLLTTTPNPSSEDEEEEDPPRPRRRRRSSPRAHVRRLTTTPNYSSQDEEVEEPPRRGRGRPPGRVALSARRVGQRSPQESAAPPVRGRGRPRGSTASRAASNAREAIPAREPAPRAARALNFSYASQLESDDDEEEPVRRQGKRRPAERTASPQTTSKRSRGGA